MRFPRSHHAGTGVPLPTVIRYGGWPKQQPSTYVNFTRRNKSTKKYGVLAISILCLLMATGSAFADEHYAEITKVKASKAFFGSSHSIYATVKSSDKDCNHYVNWWEAVSEDGKLLFRRVLGHPHSREQPFNRGGSTKSINDGTIFYVRAHMHTFGYSNKGMKGAVKTGFEPIEIPDGFCCELGELGELGERGRTFDILRWEQRQVAHLSFRINALEPQLADKKSSRRNTGAIQSDDRVRSRADQAAHPHPRPNTTQTTYYLVAGR